MALKTTRKVNQDADEILELYALQLQLPDSLYELARERYKRIARHLESCGTDLTSYDLDIFPQGSMATQTTVRPREREEFDLDFICHVDSDGHAGGASGQLTDLIYDSILTSPAYSKLNPEKCDRCIRLPYANQFHMDVVPAAPVAVTNELIKIPDKDRVNWISTNPRGLAKWFFERAALGPVVKSAADMYEAAARIEPLSDPVSGEQKFPLQRAVQLLKRRRDIAFEKDNDELAPKSIQLLVFSGTYYFGESSCSAALIAILTGIIDACSVPHVIRLVNPSNPSENLTRDWSLRHQLATLQFAEKFRKELLDLGSVPGLDSLQESLNYSFTSNERGQQYVKDAFTAFASRRGPGSPIALAPFAGAFGNVTDRSSDSCESKPATFFGE